MSSPAEDDDFAQALLVAKLLPAERIESARKGLNGVSLAEKLVSERALTLEVKEIIEDRIRTKQRGPLKRLGNYVLVKKLGEGGMGAVFLGLLMEERVVKDGETSVSRQVAIKVLKKELTQNNTAMADRFMREAKSAIKLRHENIVSAKDVGEEEGYFFYVMDYSVGEPLDALLKRDKLVPVPRALEIMTQAARGLEYAHGLGFIHRDIKPANIYLVQDGPAKLLDFGLVKQLQVGGSYQDGLTAPGTLMGSPHYISPEQIRADKVLDGQTDIYSLGATFFHLVTGKPPFQGDSAGTVIMMHMSVAPADPRKLNGQVSPELSRIILKMLAKERQFRYKNCQDLLVDLEGLQKSGSAKSEGGPAPNKENIEAPIFIDTLMQSPKSSATASKSRNPENVTTMIDPNNTNATTLVSPMSQATTMVTTPVSPPRGDLPTQVLADERSSPHAAEAPSKKHWWQFWK